MVRLVRSAVVALVAVLVALVGALPASATDEGPTASPSPTSQVYGCIDPVDSYGAPRACQLLVQVLSPVCDNDVPKLRYLVSPVGTPKDKVTITFVNPAGPDVVHADQPLAGSVLWPGAVVGPDGRGADWPGWTKRADGSWVTGDEFDWVRPSVQVLFDVGGAAATVTVAYPPSSPTCLTDPPKVVVVADPPPTATPSATPTTVVAAAPQTTASTTVVLAANPTSTVLSATGAEVQPLLLAGIALVLVGALAVAAVSIARRRRTTP
jgi:hypothetical protein